jgi:biotin operon repressor
VTDNERILLSHIKAYCRGKRNAQSASDLAGWLRSTERSVRAMIRNLRLEGHPVCGVPSEGFYVPTSREEGQHTLLNLLSQERALGEVREAFEDGLEREFGPERLFEGV